jgi:hypothetical protein
LSVRAGQFAAVLALALLALVAAALGFYLSFCPAVSGALAMAMVATLYLFLLLPQAVLVLLIGVALVVFVVEPFKTARRRRWLKLGYGPALLGVMGVAALVATRLHMSQCNLGVWH